MPWDQLAEARIRAWLDRPPEERAAAGPALEPGPPLEVQLWSEVRELDRMATETTSSDEADALRQAADGLMLRLCVWLESQGRPIAARELADRRLAREREG
jgi:hypothetical protein